jgi:hypothetical protein
MHICLLVIEDDILHTCIHAYMYTITHAYMHTCDTCIHAYMHTCIHAYMQTWIALSSSS